MRALPAANANITAADTEIQMIPSTAYLSDHLGRCQGYGIMVLTVTGGMLSAITGFLGSGMFRHFGLRKPGTLPGYTCITAEQQRPSRGVSPVCR